MTIHRQPVPEVDAPPGFECQIYMVDPGVWCGKVWRAGANRYDWIAALSAGTPEAAAARLRQWFRERAELAKVQTTPTLKKARKQ